MRAALRGFRGGKTHSARLLGRRRGLCCCDSHTRDCEHLARLLRQGHTRATAPQSGTDVVAAGSFFCQLILIKPARRYSHRQAPGAPASARCTCTFGHIPGGEGVRCCVYPEPLSCSHLSTLCLLGDCCCLERHTIINHELK